MIAYYGIMIAYVWDMLRMYGIIIAYVQDHDCVHTG